MNPKLTHAIVRGTPIDVGGRIFVPEARVTTLVEREATFESKATGVFGLHFRRIKPTALIEQTPDGERRHRIEDATARTLFGYGAATLALAALGAIGERLISRRTIR